MNKDLIEEVIQTIGGVGTLWPATDPAQLANVPLSKRREPEKPSWDNPTPLPAHVRSVQLNPRLLAVHMASARHPRDGMEWS